MTIRLIRTSVLLAVFSLSACHKPEPQPVQDPAATAAARRAEGDAAIRARRAELRAQREQRAAAQPGQRRDQIMRDVYETCRRNHDAAACDRMRNNSYSAPTKGRPNPDDPNNLSESLRTRP